MPGRSAAAATGYTHVKSGTTTLNSRIDYWFSELAAPIALNSVAVAGQAADSDHLAVVATYAIDHDSLHRPRTVAGARAGADTAPADCSAVTETTLFSDGFAAFDAAQWPTRVITGTQDSTIKFAATGGRLRIGDLKEATSGAHYYGISTAALQPRDQRLRRRCSWRSRRACRRRPMRCSRW